MAVFANGDLAQVMRLASNSVCLSDTTQISFSFKCFFQKVERLPVSRHKPLRDLYNNTRISPYGPNPRGTEDEWYNRQVF